MTGPLSDYRSKMDVSCSTHSLHDHLAMTDAVRSVRHASRNLMEATYRLDEAGFSCSALNKLSADTSALLADWSGRPVPAPWELVPDWISDAAVEWRRDNRRKY